MVLGGILQASRDLVDGRLSYGVCRWHSWILDSPFRKFSFSAVYSNQETKCNDIE